MGRPDDPFLQWAVDLLNYADPDASGMRMVMDDGLMAGRCDRAGLERAVEALNAVLADEAISNGEIKGLLNRASGRTWGIEYQRTFQPRAFLGELERALKEYVRRHPELR